MTGKMLMNKNGRVLCITKDDAYGLTELRDDSGDLLGFYDSVQDETRDGAGVLVGNGNMLPILL